jgi:FkbM family methyltransferase
LAKARAIEGFYQDIPVETDRGTLRFHITNRQTLKCPIEFDSYEPDTLIWIKGFPEGAVLWDIGANIGLLSLYAAAQSDVRVLAFEPAAATYAVLVKNIEINQRSDRISAYCIALSNETKCGSLNMATTEAGSFLHAFEDDTNVHDEIINVFFAQSTIGFTLDDFIRLFNPPLPSHVKIDVDSTETLIIEGGKGLFGGKGVQSVYIEMEGSKERKRNQRIISQMKGLGYAAKPGIFEKQRNVEFRKD